MKARSLFQLDCSTAQAFPIFLSVHSFYFYIYFSTPALNRESRKIESKNSAVIVRFNIHWTPLSAKAACPYLKDFFLPSLLYK
jgi:hypothetical protein